MYPNHPLLQQNTTTSPLWTLPGFSQFGPDTVGNLVMPGHFGAIGQEQVNRHVSFDPQLAQAAPHIGLDLAIKKRACDQCNHSKVRCDCADPCSRCAHRAIQCTYTKQQRVRGSGFGPPVTTAIEPVAKMPLSGISPTTVIRNSPMLSNQARMPGPDALVHDGIAVARPPVPDPHGDASIQQTMGGQPPDHHGLHQSPANLVTALTPALTNSTSPTNTETSSDRRGSNGNWILPPSTVAIPSHGDFGGIQMDGVGLASSFHGSTNLFRTRADSLYNDSVASPNYAPTLLTEDEEASPTGWADKDVGGRRRFSSASGQWAGALDQLHLDEPHSQGVTFDAHGNIQFELPPPQRHSTFPMAPVELPANLSRAPSGQDINFWKLFLDPAALASPDVQELAFAADTPRGLSRSNSMPDLKTPPTVTVNYAPIQLVEAMSNSTAPHGAIDQQQQPFQAQQQHQQRANSDDTDMDRWRDHIQQRHASFSMSMEPSVRKVHAGEQGVPMFASGEFDRMRPPPNPLQSNAAMQQTLAPERTPSFGLGVFDATTPKGNPRTPTAHLLSMYAGFERPNNKRMASQTLIPVPLQKRQQTYPPDEEVFTDSSASSSRRSSHISSHIPPRPMPSSSLYQSSGLPTQMVLVHPDSELNQ
ncbi:hypothetical protein CspeluHIS016_0211660 [Cutaneotrichosporon spelunceum]|uniref:Zn(2)-C6 fungal-type domain-containing protein n=1 Tax=Cutaneotrichosporon spelunceum TaxID=1672016 RepID=A0AAD3TTD9_9TREE|nr:hypothetical protein CspeluHIS016_0211660 [Cutaneotrichosporon spelunceum]